MTFKLIDEHADTELSLFDLEDYIQTMTDDQVDLEKPQALVDFDNAITQNFKSPKTKRITGAHSKLVKKLKKSKVVSKANEIIIKRMERKTATLDDILGRPKPTFLLPPKKAGIY